MAKIGLKYPVAAEITAETYGAAPTYDTGFVIGKAVTAKLSIEANDSPLYGDDSQAETDTSFASGTIELGVTDFGNTVSENLTIQAKLLGQTVATEDGVSVLTVGGSDNAPYFGIGYVRPAKLNGTKYWEAKWLYKVQFKPFNEEATTKNGNIEWQTPAIEGKIMIVEGLGNDTYQKKVNFTTEAEAKAWVYAKAGITGTVSKTTLAATIATAEGKSAETYTSTSYATMFVALLAAQGTNSNVYASQAMVDGANTALTNAIAALATRV